MSYECILFLIFKTKFWVSLFPCWGSLGSRNPACCSRLAECWSWRGPSTTSSLLRAAWTGRTCMSNCMSACFTFLPAKIRWLRRGPSLFPLVVSRLHSNSVLRGWVLLRKLFRMRCKSLIFFLAFSFSINSSPVNEQTSQLQVKFQCIRFFCLSSLDKNV